MIDSLQKIDRIIFLAINSFHFEWLNSVMSFISESLIWLPIIIFILWKAKSKHSIRFASLFFLFGLLAVISNDALTSYIIKNSVTRLRPCRLEELKVLINTFGQKCGGKYGFVSSHAANSIALISFTFFALCLEGKKYWWVWTFPIMIGWSRIYLGVHYPGDILGGFVIGISLGYLFSILFKNIPTVQDDQLSN